MVKVILKPITDGFKSVELPVGKTVLGRGPLLGCTDKKVSRNHAVMDVTAKGNIFLTPIHVNPCFYRTKSDDSLKTMKKDHVQQLYHGDIISLLPTTFEYEICLETSAVLGEKENNTLTTTVPKDVPDFLEDVAECKDKEDMEENTQVEKNENNKDFATNNNDEKTNEDVHDENTHDNKALADIEEIEHNERLEVRQPSSANNGKDNAVSKDKCKGARHHRTLPSWLAKYGTQGGTDGCSTNQKQEITQSRTVTAIARSRTKGWGGDSKQGMSRSARKNRQTRQKISLDDFEVSEDDQWNSEESDKQAVGGAKSDSEWESEEASSSDWDVKKRKRRGRGDSSESDWGAANLRKRTFRRGDISESGSDWETENRKKAKKTKGRRAKKKSDSDDSDGDAVRRPRRASTSQPDSSKRTSCMYGKKCYRRQQQHISQFSHPGDSDYESPDDEEEESKECPYGVDCYRKNSQHRKEFTHTKKVRPKREAAKKAGKKKEDDGDADDSRDVDLSFENDSDAYAPESDVSGAGSETEELVKDSKKVLMNRKKAV